MILHVILDCRIEVFTLLSKYWYMVLAANDPFDLTKYWMTCITFVRNYLVTAASCLIAIILFYAAVRISVADDVVCLCNAIIQIQSVAA